MMKSCFLFGHRDAPEEIRSEIEAAVEDEATEDEYEPEIEAAVYEYEPEPISEAEVIASARSMVDIIMEFNNSCY